MYANLYLFVGHLKDLQVAQILPNIPQMSLILRIDDNFMFCFVSSIYILAKFDLVTVHKICKDGHST